MSITAEHFRPKRKRKNKGSVSPSLETIENKNRSISNLGSSNAYRSTVNFNESLPNISEGDRGSKMTKKSSVFRRKNSPRN